MIDQEKLREEQRCTYSRRPIPNATTQTLILLVIHYFDLLAANCEHKHPHDDDCHHPDQDFNCMCCAPCNCPLLLEADKRK